MSSIQGVFSAACTLPMGWGTNQLRLFSALRRASARRRASSLMILFMPKICGLTASACGAVVWAWQLYPASMASNQVPSTSCLVGALGLVYVSGQILIHDS
jgi:hypothetical protein